MPELLDDLIHRQAHLTPTACALIHKDNVLNYVELASHIDQSSQKLLELGILPGERVAIYLPKVPETVFALFGASKAGGVFVPVNPLLKPQQVAYILKDCNVRILITSSDRLRLVSEALKDCHDLRSVVVIDEGKIPDDLLSTVTLARWYSAPQQQRTPEHPRRIDTDMAAILYTSGSTGNPKGVVLTHRNMMTGAFSVASYLKNSADDRLLAVLPFSFDYGLSQLTTAFSVGASVVLMDYLLPRDVIRAITRFKITGLAAVPPLWNQLAELEWPAEAADSLRYLTNSGGAMPIATTRKLSNVLPTTDFYLMYGLTEAFRSTYLPPEQVAIRPDSMGKAIPNAEILVLREDGSECAPGEPGELVHRGSLVSLGYWNDAAKTAVHFKPIPGRHPEIPLTEIAVWSGDQVRKDDEGYLYFISRKDEMIKTSGYRVSPTEIEEVLYSSGLIKEVAALGITHPLLGQAILLLAIKSKDISETELLRYCQKELPNFMLPKQILFVDMLPRNQNGKLDRKNLATEYKDIFQESTS
ncbi:acyl-CoA ligase (AMP-forming), exosortase A system-associated [Neptunomonas antarctica]|uniref:Acyl-CoA ligase (AMP-forming), exosortase A-associated n=1 Tax=Neptunomonas antarctica TaxID=619304 RepID=A0A1N7JEU5_9GAMM|nr:acyl-CoA ligase (AMP-forming), exosortase A system-associated [Neptunomonas antarctica]SIS47875.1 acyl-CoA ligase (AMP-forming), exosortase A-associated [Neptunomonas antarctica]